MYCSRCLPEYEEQDVLCIPFLWKLCSALLLTGATIFMWSASTSCWSSTQLVWSASGSASPTAQCRSSGSWMRRSTCSPTRAPRGAQAVLQLAHLTAALHWRRVLQRVQRTTSLSVCIYVLCLSFSNDYGLKFKNFCYPTCNVRYLFCLASGTGIYSLIWHVLNFWGRWNMELFQA